MPEIETLLPRPILFNAALYAFTAIMYTVAIFTLETVRPGEYVFSDRDPRWRNIFNYIAIISWPILLFGGLSLVAVRVGANVRRRRRRLRRRQRSLLKRSTNPSPSRLSRSDRSIKILSHRLPPSTRPPSTTPPATIPPATISPATIPPATIPPATMPASHTLPSTRPQQLLQQHPMQLPPLVYRQPSSIPSPPNSHSAFTSRAKVPNLLRSKKSQGSKRSRSCASYVPAGYVSVTRVQKLFAAFGFLWVCVGLAAVATSAAIVFVGQRDRYENLANVLGFESVDWKAWVVPICTGGIPLLLFFALSLSTVTKFYSTLTARGTITVGTPAISEISARDATNMDILLETMEQDTSKAELDSEDFPELSYPGAAGSNSAVLDSATLPIVPDEDTISRLMRQLRDMGFTSPEQNIAALQASCFDLEKASDKLLNTAAS